LNIGVVSYVFTDLTFPEDDQDELEGEIKQQYDVQNILGT
jgi:hypothetical protein